MLRKIFVLIISFSFFTTLLKSQDPQFSQFYANRLYLNPAFAGATKCPRFTADYRDEYPAFPNTFTTYCVSYDLYSNFLNGGVGVQIYRDNEGKNLISTTGLDLMYAYAISLDLHSNLRLALETSFIQRSISWNDLIFPDQINHVTGILSPSSEPYINPTHYFNDYSFGALYYSQMLYGGFAVNHAAVIDITQIKTNANIPRKYTIHGGAKIYLNPYGLVAPQLYISPNVILQYQGANTQACYGLYAGRGMWLIGTWVRQSMTFNYDSVIFLFGIDLENINFAYNFDLPVSKIGIGSGGAHEISVTLRLPCPEKIKKLETISCPEF